MLSFSVFTKRMMGFGLKIGKRRVTNWSSLGIVCVLRRYDGVKEISVNAPKLTFSSGERSEIRQLTKTQAISQDGITSSELQELKTQLMTMLNHPTSMAKLLATYKYLLMTEVEN